MIHNAWTRKNVFLTDSRKIGRSHCMSNRNCSKDQEAKKWCNFVSNQFKLKDSSAWRRHRLGRSDNVSALGVLLEWNSVWLEDRFQYPAISKMLSRGSNRLINDCTVRVPGTPSVRLVSVRHLSVSDVPRTLQKAGGGRNYGQFEVKNKKMDYHTLSLSSVSAFEKHQ